MNRARVVWVDYGKGIGIFLVVLGHTLRGLHTSGIIGDTHGYLFVDRWIYSFHMPLFFLLSGLFAERQIGRSPRAFLKDKLKTIAYPYLVWSVLQTLVQFATSRYTNNKPGLDDLARILVNPIQQFWFLYVLFLISLIYYGLRRLGLGPLQVFLVFAAFWFTQGLVPLGSWGPLYLVRTYGIYVALGSVLNWYGWTERVDRARVAPLVLAGLLGFGIVTASVIRSWPALLPLNLAVTACGIAASVALAVLFTRAAGLEFVRVLGVNSLEIYVAHTIASAGLRIVLQKVLKIQDVTTHILIGVAGGIILPYALSRLSRRYHFDWLFRVNSRPTASTSPPRTMPETSPPVVEDRTRE